VLVNLLNNAIKFTDDGQVAIRVRSELLPEPGRRRLFIDVIDSGIGLKTEALLEVLKPFRQAEFSLARSG
jgi:signal transduction histidine kinase